MKIRQGFVSNSSSSSFIAVGLKVKKAHLEDVNIGWDHPYHVFDDAEEGYNDPSYSVIGEIIAQGDEYDMDNEEYSLREITNVAKEISEKFELLGEPVVITGVRMT